MRKTKYCTVKNCRPSSGRPCSNCDPGQIHREPPIMWGGRGVGFIPNPRFRLNNTTKSVPFSTKIWDKPRLREKQASERGSWWNHMIGKPLRKT